MLHKIIPALLAPLLAFAAAGQDAAPKTIFESKALLPNGTFEAASPVENGGTAHPAGWMLESPADGAPDLWAADRETALQGGASLRLAGGVQPVRVASDPIVLDAEFTSLGVVAMCRGAGGTAALRWLAGDGTVLREDALESFPAAGGGEWTRHALKETARPGGAERVVMLLGATAGEGAACWWDGVDITGNFERIPSARVLVNQVGYERFMAKRFVVETNFQKGDGTFELVNQDGRSAFSGVLAGGERITGANNSDWGFNYYYGDFTDLNDEGVFTVRVKAGGVEAAPATVKIVYDLLWKETFDPVVRALSRCRNTGEGPWWTDPAGEQTVSDMECLWTLTGAWAGLQWRLKIQGGVSPLEEETLWGLSRAAQLAEKDLSGVADGDLPKLAASLALAARKLGDAPLTTAATAACGELKRRMAAGDPAPFGRALPFSAAWDLHKATESAEWLEQAKAWYPGINSEAMDPLLEYESDVVDPRVTIPITVELGATLSKLAESLRKPVKNAFGLYAAADGADHTFFLPVGGAKKDAPQGNTRRVLAAGEMMGRAYRFVAQPENLAFVYNQLNWLLGVNPAGICLLEGAPGGTPAKAVMPGGQPAADRAAWAGFPLDGVIARGPGDDRPWLPDAGGDAEMRAAYGVSLCNTVKYIGLLSQVKRIRTVLPEEPKR